MRAGTNDLMTVDEVSAAMAVTPTQVHNLCKTKKLVKIQLPAGRRKHPAGAAVITRESFDRLMWDRELEASPTPAGPAEPPRSRSMHDTEEELRQQVAELRAELGKERQRNAALTVAVKALAASLDRTVEGAADPAPARR